MLKSKKAQTTQTLVWVIATFIIIGILLISLSLSFVIGNAKQIKKRNNPSLENQGAILELKTNFAYKLNSLNKNEIKTILESLNND